MYRVLLYYKYIHIENPESLMHEQRRLCEKLSLKGRIIIAEEGMNGTVEGTTDATEKYIQEMVRDPLFAGIHWKKSDSDGKSFPKLSIKVRSEIVSGHLGAKDINPNRITGKYITPEDLHEWIHGEHECSDEFHKGLEYAHSLTPHPNPLPQGARGYMREFYIVDMRNDFEQKVGYFDLPADRHGNSIFPGMTQFRDLASSLPRLEHLRNKTVVTVCTGGVRCEKASGFLVANGFCDVYQLQGGIVSYMEKYPNLDFVGSLYVFDQRLVMGFNTNSSNHKIVGVCEKCNKPSEHFINCINNNCHRHFIACESCLNGENAMLCPIGCRTGIINISQ